MPPNFRRRKIKSNAVFRSILSDKSYADERKHISKSSGAVFHEMPHMSQETAKASDFTAGDSKKNPISSILERNALDEFLEMSLSSQKLFTEANDVRLLVRQSNQQFNHLQVDMMEIENDFVVPIPRRPVNYGSGTCDKAISAAELDVLEKASFLKWRLHLADIEEKQGKIMTPYEKNIQFWRQLWRVLERSTVVFEILDARDPCFYRSRDLESYVNEICPSKRVIILLNKSDLVPRFVRRLWAHYFHKRHIHCLFFSALGVLSNSKFVEPQFNDLDDEVNLACFSQEDFAFKNEFDLHLLELSRNGDILCTDRFLEVLQWLRSSFTSSRDMLAKSCFGSHTVSEFVASALDEVPHKQPTDDPIKEPHPQSEQRDEESQQYQSRKTNLDQITNHYHVNFVAGFVGYPNVGKSSIMNALLKHKSVGVSRQPGKTKHFQTFLLPQMNITLCDCPGLVFPQIVATKAHLLINGVTSIDHMKGVFTPAIQLICNTIGNQLLEYYSVKLNQIKSPNRPLLDARDFLTALAESRHQTAGGRGGVPRLFDVAKTVLKDYCSGHLIHWISPTDLGSLSSGRERLTPASLNIPITISSTSCLDEPFYEFIEDCVPKTCSKSITQRKARFIQKRIRQGKSVIAGFT